VILGVNGPWRWGLTVKTRIACIILVVVGILVDGLFLHFSFDPKERFTRVATYAFLGYMLAVPIALFFLKGERPWRIAVFAIWLIYVSIFGYVMLTMS
jgi:hypothetical protein